MIKIQPKLKLLLKHVIAVILFFLFTIVSCSPGVSADQGIKISGPGDLYYLSVAINNQSAQGSGIKTLNMNVTTDSVSDLKQGKCDAIFMGAEPTGTELQGLKDYVIAYDAVCIIIDENSYSGGQSTGGGRPLHKTNGLKDLTTADLKQIFAGTAWQWDGDYFVSNPNLDPNSWLYKIDSVAWIKSSVKLNSAFVFPAGKYDTQDIIYQNLGLDEETIISNRSSFTSPKYNKEEEVLSYEYQGAAYSTEWGTQDFVFKLGFASRRVMTVAPQYVPVKVVSINGIDPLANPQSIYNGTYSLSRKIHILIRQQSPTTVTDLVNYLLSAKGQQTLVDAGYLPILVK
jgi:ABC-type phosphate transport system substrate-binding protein